MLTDDQRARAEAWVRAVGPRATAFARSLVRDPAAADDLVQECLYRLLRKVDDYDLGRDGLKLLFRAISNLAINNATRDKELATLDTADGPVPVADPAARPADSILESREAEAEIRAALAALPPLQRAAIELRALGLSKDEIADALGVSATNAGVLVYRGRQAVAAALDVPCN